MSSHSTKNLACALHLYLEPYLDSDTAFVLRVALYNGGGDGIPAGFFQRLSGNGYVKLLEYFQNSIPPSWDDHDSPINLASLYCQIETLNWWKNSNRALGYTEESLDEACLEQRQNDGDVILTRYFAAPLASAQKQIKKLDWWFSSGLTMIYTKRAIDIASSNGSIEVLSWWLKSGLEIKYSNQAIDMANSAESLNWWRRSGLELKYSENAMDTASREGNLDILNWWRSSGLEVKYSQGSMDEAKNIQVLDWWFHSGYALKFTYDAIKTSVCDGDIPKLKWWFALNESHDDVEFDSEELIEMASQWDHPLALQCLYENLEEFVYNSDAIDQASEFGSLASLEWWKNSGLELLYTNSAMLCAECWGEHEEVIQVLDWWKDSNLPLKYDEECMEFASYQSGILVLQWWLESNLLLKYDKEAMDSAHDARVLDWWVQSGLELKYTRNNSLRSSEVTKWWLESGLDLL